MAYGPLGSWAFPGPYMVLSAAVGAPGGPVVSRYRGYVARGIIVILDPLLSIVLLCMPLLPVLEALFGLDFFFLGLVVE